MALSLDGETQQPSLPPELRNGIGHHTASTSGLAPAIRPTTYPTSSSPAPESSENLFVANQLHGAAASSLPAEESLTDSSKDRAEAVREGNLLRLPSGGPKWATAVPSPLAASDAASGQRVNGNSTAGPSGSLWNLIDEDVDELEDSASSRPAAPADDDPPPSVPSPTSSSSAPPPPMKTPSRKRKASASSAGKPPSNRKPLSSLPTPPFPIPRPPPTRVLSRGKTRSVVQQEASQDSFAESVRVAPRTRLDRLMTGSRVGGMFRVEAVTEETERSLMGGEESAGLESSAGHGSSGEAEGADHDLGEGDQIVAGIGTSPRSTQAGDYRFDGTGEEGVTSELHIPHSNGVMANGTENSTTPSHADVHRVAGALSEANVLSSPAQDLALRSSQPVDTQAGDTTEDTILFTQRSVHRVTRADETLPDAQPLIPPSSPPQDPSSDAPEHPHSIAGVPAMLISETVMNARPRRSFANVAVSLSQNELNADRGQFFSSPAEIASSPARSVSNFSGFQPTQWQAASLPSQPQPGNDGQEPTQLVSIETYERGVQAYREQAADEKEADSLPIENQGHTQGDTQSQEKTNDGEGESSWPHAPSTANDYSVYPSSQPEAQGRQGIEHSEPSKSATESASLEQSSKSSHPSTAPTDNATQLVSEETQREALLRHRLILEDKDRTVSRGSEPPPNHHVAANRQLTRRKIGGSNLNIGFQSAPGMLPDLSSRATRQPVIPEPVQMQGTPPPDTYMPSPPGDEPSSSMQVDDQIPLGLPTQTQMTDAASPPPGSPPPSPTPIRQRMLPIHQLEPTLMDGGEQSAPTLEHRQKMPLPARTYGATSKDKVSPAKPPQPNVSMNRQLAKRKARRVDSSPASEHEGLVPEAADDDPMDADPLASNLDHTGVDGSNITSSSEAQAQLRRSRDVTAEDDIADGGSLEEEEPTDDDESPPTEIDSQDETYRPMLGNAKDKQARISTTSSRDRAPPAKARTSNTSVIPSSKIIGSKPGPTRRSPRKAPPVGAATVEAGPSRVPRNKRRKIEDAADETDLPTSSDEETPLDPTDESFHPVRAKKALAAAKTKALRSRQASTASAADAPGIGKAQHGHIGKGKGKGKARASELDGGHLSRSTSNTTSKTGAIGKDDAAENVATKKGKGRMVVEVGKNNKAPSREDTASSGEEEADGLANDDPARPLVFAYYRPCKAYFPARVVSCSGQSYHVVFLDNDEADVSIDHLRTCALKQGDKVRLSNAGRIDNSMSEVAENWAPVDGSIKLRSGGEGLTELSNIRLSSVWIDRHFGDRRITAEELDEVEMVDKAEDSKAIIAAPKAMAAKATTTNTRKIFSDKIFIVTPTGAQTSAIRKAIGNHGGQTCDYTDLFDKVVFGQALRSKRIPFLITPQTVDAGDGMKPKVMAALSYGIPCLAAQYIDAALQNAECDWRQYVLIAGTSSLHNLPVPQQIDLNWGTDGWNIREARHALRPLANKSVLFYDSNTPLIKDLASVCVFGLGGASFETTSSLANVTGGTFDIVLVGSKESMSTKGLPDKVRNHPKACDMLWLKHCLISGALLPCRLMSYT